MSFRKQLVSLATLPWLLAPLMAQADPTYTMTVIGPAGEFSFASGINNAGQVIGFSEHSDGSYYAFMGTGGSPTNLGTLGGNSDALGINNHGQVVGHLSADCCSDLGSAFLYSGGTLTDLGRFGRPGSLASGINDSGQIVGWVYLGPGQERAFSYSSGTISDLGTLGGSSSLARQVNNAGQIVGESDTVGAFSPHAFLYAGGTMADLGTLGGGSSSAYGINGAGQVVGGAELAGGGYHAFVYAGGIMSDLGTLYDDNSTAYGINAAGQIVGTLTNRGPFGTAFIYDHGVMADLNALIADPGWLINEAVGINDSGQIAAIGWQQGFGYRAIRLDPVAVPEPGTPALMLSCLALLGVMVRRGKRAA
jgi:probable HAF family extracellular repeat protein